MDNQILELKKLNAAYIAALEYDRCPSHRKAKEVSTNFETGVTMKDLREALDENQGRGPDEIAGDMSTLIKAI